MGDKLNMNSGALAGLVGHYGSSDSSDDENQEKKASGMIAVNHEMHQTMWSVCFDPSTGCPYYWNQITNEVSWEPPPNYVSVSSDSTNILSTQIMNDSQNLKRREKPKDKQKYTSSQSPNTSLQKPKKKDTTNYSDEEDEKIELITSYYNSDSGSGEENGDDISKRKGNSFANNIKLNPKKQKGSGTTVPFGPELPKELVPNIKNVVVESTISNSNEEKSVSKLDSQNTLQICNNINEKTETNEKYTDTSNNANEFENVEKVKNTETEILYKNASSPDETFNCDSNKDKDLFPGISDDKSNQNGYECENLSDVDNKSSTPLESDNLNELMITQASILKQLGKLEPSEIKYLNSSSANSPILSSRTHSPIGSPVIPVDSPVPVKKSNALDMDVDDLIAQIEMEQPIDQPNVNSDAHSTETVQSQDESITNKSLVMEESSEMKSGNNFNPLFPSVADNIVFEKSIKNSEESHSNLNEYSENQNKYELKIENPFERNINKYESTAEINDVENSLFKRKRRIAIDVLPAKQIKTDSSLQNIMFTSRQSSVSGERRGFGFKTDQNDGKETEVEQSNLNYLNFKKGEAIVFKKGEVLNPLQSGTIDNMSTAVETDYVEDKDMKDDDGDDNLNEKKKLIEAKLKFLTQSLPSVPPVQQLYIEFQTLWNAFTSEALKNKYMCDWLQNADSTLDRLEASAAPHPWICRFHSESGRYIYEHGETGQWQWEYPESEIPPPPPSPPLTKPRVPSSPPPDEPTDMDISSSPPPQMQQDIHSHCSVDSEPLPPGIEMPIHSPSSLITDKRTLGQLLASADNAKVNETMSNVPSSDMLSSELDSFYSDLAALEETSTPAPISSPPPAPIISVQKPVNKNHKESNEPLPAKVSNTTIKEKKKKEKTKTSALGMKNKAVSSLVAKWKKVQESLED